MRVALRRLFRIANPPAGPLSPMAHRDAWSRRLRIMMQHTYLIGVAAMLLCAGLGAFAYYFASLPTELRIAVGPPNSEDTRVVRAIETQLARDHLNVRLRIVAVANGTRGAAAAIDRGEADLAVVRHDTGLPRNGQVVAILRKNVVTFIVPSAAEPAKAAKGGKAKAAAAKKEPIEKIEQLVGKRLGVVGRSPTNLELLKAILHQYRIAPDKIVMLTAGDLAKPNESAKIGVYQFETANVGPAIRDGNFDAIMSVGPVSSPVTADAIIAATRGKEPPTFLKIDAAEAIAERNPIYESTEIKAGAFGGSPPRPEESVETIGVNHYIVARRMLAESAVADFTKHLFAIRQSLAAELPAAAKIEKPDTDKDAPVPVHPGAAAYLDGELKSFFDRYSDLMYWGLMLFSFAGSAAAGLFSYRKADDRVQRLRSLERLLEFTKAARTAATATALDELMAEIDAIHARMIEEVEANSLDETALMAYSLSLDQARTAVAARRATLPDQPRAPLAAVASL
jgi:TRAP-type uncharacterized transport system substrate-binding protein